MRDRFLDCIAALKNIDPKLPVMQVNRLSLDSLCQTNAPLLHFYQHTKVCHMGLYKCTHTKYCPNILVFYCLTIFILIVFKSAVK